MKNELNQIPLAKLYFIYIYIQLNDQTILTFLKNNALHELLMIIFCFHYI